MNSYSIDNLQSVLNKAAVLGTKVLELDGTYALIFKDECIWYVPDNITDVSSKWDGREYDEDFNKLTLVGGRGLEKVEGLVPIDLLDVLNVENLEIGILKNAKDAINAKDVIYEKHIEVIKGVLKLKAYNYVDTIHDLSSEAANFEFDCTYADKLFRIMNYSRLENSNLYLKGLSIPNLIKHGNNHIRILRRSSIGTLKIDALETYPILPEIMGKESRFGGAFLLSSIEALDISGIKLFDTSKSIDTQLKTLRSIMISAFNVHTGLSKKVIDRLSKYTDRFYEGSIVKNIILNKTDYDIVKNSDSLKNKYGLYDIVEDGLIIEKIEHN